MFTARVVPWTNSATASGATPARASRASVPVSTAAAGSAGVLGTFRTRSAPARLVQQDEVGERAPDVAAEPVRRVGQVALPRRLRQPAGRFL